GKCGTFAFRRLAEFLRRLHEVAEIMDGVFDELMQLGMRLARNSRPVTADEAPERVGIFGIRGGDETQQNRKRYRHFRLRRLAGMNVPDRIAEALLRVLALEALEELLIFVGIPRDDIEIEPLRRFWLPIHKERKTLGARVAQPFLDGEAVALR